MTIEGGSLRGRWEESYGMCHGSKRRISGNRSVMDQDHGCAARAIELAQAVATSCSYGEQAQGYLRIYP
ncbi:hypothetical protein DYH09_07385 [bacterium CPR1]|nr:hypothetical protein [bacterium CPR1]